MTRFAEVDDPIGEVSLVGEKGPELVRFDSGATVYKNAETRQALNDAHHNSVTLVSQVKAVRRSLPTSTSRWRTTVRRCSLTISVTSLSTQSPESSSRLRCRCHSRAYTDDDSVEAEPCAAQSYRAVMDDDEAARIKHAQFQLFTAEEGAECWLYTPETAVVFLLMISEAVNNGFCSAGLASHSVASSIDASALVTVGSSILI